MLRAFNRLLRPGGRTGFYTIYETPGLSPEQRRRARRSGPRAVAMRSTHQRLLSAAGYVDIEEVDVTPEFRDVTFAWRVEREKHADASRAVEGEELFRERQNDRRAGLEAIDAGLLRRALYLARRPA